MRNTLYGYSADEMKFAIVYSFVTEHKDKSDNELRTEVINKTLYELISEPSDEDYEYLYALAEFVSLDDLVSLKVGQSIRFQSHRDIVELGTCEIFRVQ